MQSYTYAEFIGDENVKAYVDFLFQFTIPMTRNRVVEDILKENRRGRLQDIPDIFTKITASDQAFALLSIVNHYDDWSGKLDAFTRRDKKTMKKVRTKWTQASARSAINTGWQPIALNTFCQCEDYFKEFMKTTEWKAIAVLTYDRMRDELERDTNKQFVQKQAQSGLPRSDKPLDAYLMDDELWDDFERIQSENTREGFDMYNDYNNGNNDDGEEEDADAEHFFGDSGTDKDHSSQGSGGILD